MFTMIILCFVILFACIGFCINAQDKDYKNALACVCVVILSILVIADVYNFMDEARSKLQIQAVEYGYAKYNVNSEGKTSYTWIIPTPPKVEPAKPIPVKPEPVVVEKN